MRQKRRVLIVDDEHDNCTMYAEYLRDGDWLVEEVTSGEEALAVALRVAPDVIVMDLAMPLVDGIEAVRRLKKHTLTRNVPIVALTAYVTRVGEALSVGCSEFLTKPCSPDALRAVLEGVVARADG